MRTLAFDGRMGASGDMLLAALVAAGADPAVLAPVEAALPVEFVVGETEKNGIRATTVDVVLAGEEDAESHEHSDEDHHDDHQHHGEDHDHHHDESAHDDHEHHHHDHTHAEGHGPHRTYAEVVELVEEMGLPADVEADSTAVFRTLGEAEAAVHGTELEETHFHEVGADDAVADVVGVCLLLADLGVERVLTTPVAAGGGEVEMSHGVYPVPAPAVVNIAAAADWELVGGPVEAELLTPTGAAILAHFGEGVESLPPMRIEASGYGAGGYTFPDHPNVLRALVGESRGTLVRDEMRLLETTVDDVSPEVLGSLQETLFEAGARDVTVVPATMKKSRPGHVVKVIVHPSDVAQVARTFAVETGTLGVRETGFTHRWIAERRFATASLLVDGERHDVTVKVASDDAGEAYDVSAEYDDCVAVARETGLAVRDVVRRAEAAAREGGALDDVVCHLVEGERWAEFAEREAYDHPSLDADGYIHFSRASHLVPVAEVNHGDATALKVLVCDRESLEADLEYAEQPSGAYPHLYGELPMDAVLDVLTMPRKDGRFVLPPSLAE